MIKEGARTSTKLLAGVGAIGRAGAPYLMAMAKKVAPSPTLIKNPHWVTILIDSALGSTDIQAAPFLPSPQGGDDPAMLLQGIGHKLRLI